MNWTGGRGFRGEVIRHGPGCECSMCVSIDKLDREAERDFLRGLFWGLLITGVLFSLGGWAWHLFAKK